MAGEAPGWSDWWPNRPDGGDKQRLNERGLLLLNPFMGDIYFWSYEQRHRCEWTVVAELLCGMVTGLAYVILVSAGWLAWSN